MIKTRPFGVFLSNQSFSIRVSKKEIAMNKKNEITLRSSAAEYLTFITASGEGGVEAIYADENVWLSQKMMALLYDVETNTINYHLKKAFSDKELYEDSVIRIFRITATDGKQYNTIHYNLQAIITARRPRHFSRKTTFLNAKNTPIRRVFYYQ